MLVTPAVVVDSSVNPLVFSSSPGSSSCSLGHLTQLPGSPGPGSLHSHLTGESRALLVLQPPDLGGGPVALVVAGRDPEDDGGLGGGVYVGSRQTEGREVLVTVFSTTIGRGPTRLGSHWSRAS